MCPALDLLLKDRYNRLVQTLQIDLSAPVMPVTIPSHDLLFMRAALEEAARATSLGEVPIAAVLVRQEAVLARFHNHRETWQDPTAHAELIAIRAGSRQLGTWRLSDCTLYVTVEPCAMCLGAIILARIPRLVFGAWDPKGGACGSVVDLTQEPRLNHGVSVIGGVLQEESQALLQEFFRGLRKDPTSNEAPRQDLF